MVAPLALIALCGADERRSIATKSATTPPLAEFGGKMPSTGLPDRRTGNANDEMVWRRAEARVWPPTCRALQVVTVIGRIESETRECRLIDVRGVDPVAEMAATGVLISDDGKRYPVGWTWSQDPSRIKASECPARIPDQGHRTYQLARSPGVSRWRVWLEAPRYDVLDLGQMEPDWVKTTCDQRDRKLPVSD